MGKIMEKFTDSVARKIWNQMEEEQRKCKESKTRGNSMMFSIMIAITHIYQERKKKNE